MYCDQLSLHWFWMWDHLQKWPCKTFQSPYTNQSRYSVLKHKNVNDESLLHSVYFKNLLLIFCVASLFLNNCFNMPWMRCIKILHWYEMPFSVNELPKFLKLCWFFWQILLFSSVHIFLIFKSGFWTGQSLYTVTPSSANLCCIACNLSAIRCIWLYSRYHQF